MVLETFIIVAVMALLLWGALKWIAATPAVLVDVKPCRGNWAEARLRQCHCGIAVTGIPVEPINVYTSLAYLAAGWVTIRVMAGPPSWVLGVAMLLLAIGSGLYHGCKAMWAARADHAGMYAVFAALAFYAMAPEHRVIPYVMAVAALAAAITFAFLFPGNLSLRMGLLLSLMAVRAVLLGSWVLGVVSLAVFAVAMGSWLVDRNTNWLGRLGHGLWHVLTAIAIAAMFVGLA
ncbi:MAG: hypothetical protein IH616_13490 [Gemmatimonadales bacterium]|nr:hypothetical protein [Gemmatimonadales bacterium]